MKKTMEISKRSMGKELGILSRATQKFLRHQFKEYDIGHAQLMTLHFICRNDGLSQNELVNYFQLDKSSITSQLNKLEKNGYIIREINSRDSRGRRIYKTEKTKEMEDALHEKFLSWSKVLVNGLSIEDLEFAFNVIDKMKMNSQQDLETILDE